ncbi:MAG: hypothetical protein ACFB20_12805 [Opitutales bacterium]
MPLGSLLADYAGLWVVLAGLLLLWPADLLARWLMWNRASTMAGVLCVLPVLAILVQVAPWEGGADEAIDDSSQARERDRQRSDSRPERPRRADSGGIGFGRGYEAVWNFDAEQAQELEAELRGNKLRAFLVNPPEEVRPVRYFSEAARAAKVPARAFSRSVQAWTNAQLADDATPRVERARALLVYGKRAQAAEEAGLAAEDDDALWAEAKLLEGDAWLLEGQFESAFQAFNEGLDFPPGPLTPQDVQGFLLGRASAAREVLVQETMPVEQKLMYLKQAAEDYAELAKTWEPDQIREEAQSWVSAAMCRYALATLTDASEAKVPLLEQAIDGFHEALRLHPQELRPMDHAWVRYSLGEALLGLHYAVDASGDATGIALEAVEHLKAALATYDRRSAPYLWGNAQFYLGGAYGAAASETLDPIDAEAYWLQALAATESALTVYGRRVDAFRWAQLQSHRGTVTRALAQLTPDRAEEVVYFRESALALRRALTIWTRGAAAEMWASTQVSLGLTYQAHGLFLEEGSTESDMLLEASVEAFTQALTVLTETEHTEEWANTQGALGTSYEALGLRAQADRCFEHFRRHNPGERLPTGPLADDDAVLDI